MMVPCDYVTNCTWPACTLSCEGRKTKSFLIATRDELIWNEAIMAAANKIESTGFMLLAYEIRSLKK